MIAVTPKWTWRSVSVIVVSIFFWLLFLSATIFLGKIVVIKVSKGGDGDILPNLILVACMVFGLIFWTSGLIKWFGTRYKIFTDAEFLVWREQSFFRIRDQRFMLKSITGIFDSGTPNIGYSLLLEVNGKIHRLGSLLSKNDIYQLSRFIEQTKTKASDAGKQSSASA